MGVFLSATIGAFIGITSAYNWDQWQFYAFTCPLIIWNGVLCAIVYPGKK